MVTQPKTPKFLEFLREFLSMCPAIAPSDCLHLADQLGEIAGPESDIRPAIADLDALARQPGQGELCARIFAWIAAHNQHVAAGWALVRDVAIATGEREPETEDRDNVPTDRIVFATRAVWIPDVEADRRAQCADVSNSLAELARSMAPDDFAELIAHSDTVIDAAEFLPPIVCDDLTLDETAESDDRAMPLPAPPDSAAVPSGVPVELSASAREAGDALGAALASARASGSRTPRASLEPASGSRTRRRWLATAAGALATLAVVAVAFLPSDSAAEAQPLPVFAAHPTCPPSVPVEPAAESAAEPEPEPAAAVFSAPAPRVAPPPVAPRRAVSAVRLTDGVRVRRRGKPDMVIRAQEAAPSDPPGYVIDAAQYGGTGITFPGEADLAIVVEIGGAQ